MINRDDHREKLGQMKKRFLMELINRRIVFETEMQRAIGVGLPNAEIMAICRDLIAMGFQIKFRQLKPTRTGSVLGKARSGGQFSRRKGTVVYYI